jgi:hypothetical protein
MNYLWSFLGYSIKNEVKLTAELYGSIDKNKTITCEHINLSTFMINSIIKQKFPYQDYYTVNVELIPHSRFVQWLNSIMIRNIPLGNYRWRRHNDFMKYYICWLNDEGDRLLFSSKYPVYECSSKNCELYCTYSDDENSEYASLFTCR